MSKIDSGKVNSHSAPQKGKSVYHGTTHFGHVIPTYFCTLIPQAKIKGNVEQFIRLGSMPTATFGRCEMRNYVRAVEIPEIWTPFESMLKGEYFTQGSSTYRPTSLPFVTALYLGRWLLQHSTFTIYLGTYDDDQDAYIYNAINPTQQTVNLVNDNLRTQFGITSTDTILFMSNYDWHQVGDEEYTGIMPDGSDYQQIVNVAGLQYMVCFKFQRPAKNLKKILDALGYHVGTADNINQNILRLCAYYKAWFDTFAPKTIGTENNTWNNTFCAKLLYDASNRNITNIMSDPTTAHNFEMMLEDLSMTYFFSDPDFITSHISLPNYSPVMPELQSGDTDMLVLDPQSSDYIGNVHTEANKTPYMKVDAYADVAQTKFAHDLLIKMTRWMNANTFIGGKVDLYLKKYYGAEYIQKVSSTLLGTFNTNIDIFDVDLTANTEIDGQLSIAGVPQGKGIGHGKSGHFSYQSKTFAYIFVMSVIVPEARYCQSRDITLSNLKPTELYMRMFDSLGYTLSDISSVCDTFSFGNGRAQDVGHLSKPFGFRPRYFEYKTIALFRDVLSGDFRNHSTSETMSSFYTNRYMHYGQLKYELTENANQFKVKSGDELYGTLPVANSMYGSIGRFAWLGNFNRIFTDQYDFDAKKIDKWLPSFGNETFIPVDNFILNQNTELSVSAPWIPVSESWDIKQSDDESSMTKIY